MINKNMVLYKPGLTMDTPVTVTMAAADWAIFMNWTSDPHNRDQVGHLIAVIGFQVQEAIYDQASIKAAIAQAASVTPRWNPFAGIGFETVVPNPEDFMEETNDDDEENDL